LQKGILAFSCFGLLLAIRLPMTAADAKKGESVFENCAVCHNADSTEVKIGPGLKGLFKREKLVTGKPVNEKNVLDLIDTGSNAMPPFADALSKEEKENVVAYLKTL